MRILLKTVLDCEPEAAMRALLRPEVMRQAAAPVVSVRSLAADGFPARWRRGPHPVSLRALGLVELGTQLIDLRLQRKGDALLLRDGGRPMTGLLALVTRWEHTMAVAPAPGGGTLYRDRLRFSAGILTPAVWPVLFALWQWRLHRIERLATRWR